MWERETERDKDNELCKFVWIEWCQERREKRNGEKKRLGWERGEENGEIARHGERQRNKEKDKWMWREKEMDRVQ